MPTLNLSTNVPVDAVVASDILKDATKIVAKIIGKPESVISVYLYLFLFSDFIGYHVFDELSLCLIVLRFHVFSWFNCIFFWEFFWQWMSCVWMWQCCCCMVEFLFCISLDCSFSSGVWFDCSNYVMLWLVRGWKLAFLGHIVVLGHFWSEY